VLRRAERKPPFHLQRLLTLDAARPRLAHATVLNTTAGIFAGDRLRLEVQVAPGAAAAIGTSAAGRAFGMPDGHGEVETRIEVEAGGYLEYLPRPLILCRDTALRQRTVLEVVEGGRLAWGEVIAFGREAHGERHAYRELQSRLELWVAGRLVLAEALRLDGGSEATAPGMLGNFAAAGVLLLACPEEEAAVLLTQVRQRLAAEPAAGASLLHGVSGIAVRLLGGSAHAVYEVLHALCLAFRAEAFNA
jgi:urease accessory protein